MMPAAFPKLPKNWKSSPLSLLASDGKTQLKGTLHEAESRQDHEGKHRILIVLHGMGEHRGRYTHVPHYMQKDLGAVYVYDQRGHGETSGTRGHVENFDDLARDAASVVQYWQERLQKESGKAEIHFLGHSMGGHVTLRMLILFPNLPLASVTASAPFLGVKVKVPAIKIALAKAILPVLGSVPLGTGLDAKGISHDPSVVECYTSDPLNHDKMTPRFFFDMQAAMKNTLEQTQVSYPLQILVPLADPIVDPEPSIRFYNQVTAPDKRLKTYPGFFHEPMNEMGKDQVFEDIRSWILGHPER